MKGLMLSVTLFAVLLQGQPRFVKTTFGRLSPRSFRQLPTAVVESLEARKCLIPQYPYTKAPHNVIHGSFTGAKRNEWAVLCSRRGISSILIFSAKPAKLIAEVAPKKDNIFLQQEGKGKPYYSRVISAVGKEYILKHYEAYGGPEPPPITHQGIDDGFAERASVVWYFYRGKWLELQGAD